jgi:hypothetical protein
MAQNFLTSINLNANELQKALLHPLAAEPAVGPAGQVYYNTTEDVLYVSDGVAWNPASDISAGDGLSETVVSGVQTLSVNVDGSTIEINSDTLRVKAGGIGANELAATAVTAGDYGDSTHIATFTVDADGRLTAAGEAEISTTLSISGDTGADTVSLIDGTLNFEGGDGITTVASDDNVKIDVDSTVVRTSGAQTIGGNKTFSNNVIINGDLTVSGATTTKISETVLIEDNIITLNSNETGAPSENSGIEVERGTSTNVSLLWNESDDRWKFTNDGATFYNIPVPSEYDNFSFSVAVGATTQEVSNAGTLTFAQGGGLTVGISGDDTITFSHDDTSSQASVDNSGLTVIQDVTVDTYGHTTALGSVDLTAGIDGRITARDYKASIGNGTATSFELTHNLGTRDVIVQLFDNSTFDTVYADVVRTTTNTVDISFTLAPSLNDIRVLITKIG